MAGSERGASRQSDSDEPVRVGVSVKALQAQLLRIQERAPQHTELPLDWSSGEGRWRKRDLMLKAGVPKRYVDSEWEHAQQSDEFQKYCSNLPEYKNTGNSLVINGPVGTGKSSVAALIAGEAVMADLSVLWQYIPDVFDQMSERQSRVSMIKQAVHADVLIWDDFGVGGFSEWQVGYLERIVERRYQLYKPMIVTTNLTRKALGQAEQLQRMVDRWRERGFAITLGGESMRTAHGKTQA